MRGGASAARPSSHKLFEIAIVNLDKKQTSRHLSSKSSKSKSRNSMSHCRVLTQRLQSISTALLPIIIVTFSGGCSLSDTLTFDASSPEAAESEIVEQEESPPTEAAQDSVW